MTIPIGFGLNPRKYASTVLEATKRQGAAIFGEPRFERCGKAD